MNRRPTLTATDRPATRLGLHRTALFALAVVAIGVVGAIGSTSASAQSAPQLPAACLPISGPNHGGGNQYEVRFKMLRDCDEAVGAFRSIVGQTAPERPDNSPRIWWDVAGWKCEATSDRQIFATYCESGDRGLAFYPIPQGLASPTTVLIGSVPDGVTDARILVNGSPVGDEVCIVSGPSVSARGRVISKWMVTGKSPDLTVGCAFAQTWLARMVRQTGHGGSRAMTVAPRGWKCWGTLPGSKAIAGSCKKNGTNGTTFFAWSPAPN